MLPVVPQPPENRRHVQSRFFEPNLQSQKGFCVIGNALCDDSQVLIIQMRLLVLIWRRCIGVILPPTFLLDSLRCCVRPAAVLPNPRWRACTHLSHRRLRLFG